MQHVGRTPDVFCSGEGVGLGEVPRDLLELNASFLVMDAPRHTKLRRVVSGAFTPRQVAKLEGAIAAEATRVVDEFVDGGGGDVVRDLAMKLPLWTISTMMGVPDSMRPELYAAAEGQLSAQDPEFAPEGKTSGQVAVESATTLHRLAGELVAARAGRPPTTSSRPSSTPSSTVSRSATNCSVGSSYCSPPRATTPPGTAPATE